MKRLLAVCAVISVVALVGLVIGLVLSEEEQAPRFTTITEAIEDDAAILDADRHGAITLTANGRVRGFNRSGEKLWERRFSRYEPNNRVLLDARATCVERCPQAFVRLPTGYESLGGIDRSRSLARAMTDGEMQLLAAISTAAVFVAAPTETGTALRTLTAMDTQRPSAPTERSIPIAGPGYVGVAANADRAVVGSIGGDPPGGAARISSLQASAGVWKLAGRPIPEVESANACISADGKMTAIASTRVRVAAFGRAPSMTLGRRISRGTCSIDSRGVTVAIISSDRDDDVTAVRYAFDGRQIWKRDLGNVRLLSDADAANLVVRSATSGVVTVLDGTSGEKLLEEPLGENTFAADDGALVTADRKGRPTWVDVPSGRSP